MMDSRNAIYRKVGDYMNLLTKVNAGTLDCILLTAASRYPYA